MLPCASCAHYLIPGRAARPGVHVAPIAVAAHLAPPVPRASTAAAIAFASLRERRAATRDCRIRVMGAVGREPLARRCFRLRLAGRSLPAGCGGGRLPRTRRLTTR